MHPEKNSLSIRLTEPVVPLRGIPLTEHAHNNRVGETLPPAAVVRGLLTLRLAKPTKVSSIELELAAKATTRYGRGAGPSRIDITEQYLVHSASTVVFKARPAPHGWQRPTPTGNLDLHIQSTGRVPLSGVGSGCRRAPSDLRPNFGRSVSFDPRFLMDGQQLGSGDLDDGSNPQQNQISIDPAPPYFAQAGSHSFINSSQSHRPVAGRSVSGGPGDISVPLGSPAISQYSLTPDSSPCSSPASSEHSTCYFSPPRSSTIGEIPEDGNESDDIANYGESRTAAFSLGGNLKQDDRGRSHSRFLLGGIVDVLDAVKDRARSWSPRTASGSQSIELEDSGRSWAKGKGKAQVHTHGTRRALPQIGHAKPSVVDGVNSHSGDGWTVFPEGTYTYPMYFTIPNNSPPTANVNHGSLIWKVKAEVKRPGTFKSKMTAQKEVTVVSLLKDDDSDEVEGVDLCQQWEDQFQYHVQVTGRAFPVGGKIPFQLTIMPLTKIKVHCISVCLDERTEYYARGEPRPRQDAIRRASLLAIRQDGASERYTEPILPLASEPDAFRKSPLYRFLNPEEDESEVASSFMGSGPWTIHHQLRLPDSCSILHPSNQTKGSNVMVNHKLKVTLRVEKDEGAEMIGRKKLYDIIVHIPIQILSCHCTSEWTSLPRYNVAGRPEGDSLGDILICPCRTRSHATTPTTHSQAVDTLERITSLATTSLSPPRGLDVFPSDSLASRTHLHERLMSGLVDERGETPPSYTRFEVICA